MSPRADAAVAVLALAGGIAACSGAGVGGEPPAIEVLATDTHCEPPPAEAGAAVLGSGEAGSWHVRLGMGERRTGGYAVEIADPEPFAHEAGTARIRVRWREPDDDAMVTQALTRPCVDVAVPAAFDAVHFVDDDGVVRGRAERPRE